MLNGLLANFDGVVEKLRGLVNMIQGPVIAVVSAILGLWGIYIAVKIAIANKNEDKVNAKEMIKQLVIGIIIGAVVMAVGPLTLQILELWAKGEEPTPAPTAAVQTSYYRVAELDLKNDNIQDVTQNELIIESDNNENAYYSIAWNV